MDARRRFRPEDQGPEPPSLHEVQRSIERLDREDRAMLRPWILARYDVRGYRAAGLARPADPVRELSAAHAGREPQPAQPFAEAFHPNPPRFRRDRGHGPAAASAGRAKPAAR